ncbi:MAG: hypothetical protein L0L95_14170 [Staphylococcus equorum]|nr:hypothetical protein [Staphylococcus equorum]
MSVEKTEKVNNFNENLQVTLEYAKEKSIKKILIFTKDGDAAIEAKNKAGFGDIDIIAVSFPANEVLYVKNEEGEITEKQPESSSPEVRKRLSENNIELVLSSMPFADIVIPGSSPNPYNIIEKSLSLVDEGLPLCVQSVLMATDNGYIIPGERVVSMISCTAIDASATNSRFLFHPKKGLKINSIISKKTQKKKT